MERMLNLVLFGPPGAGKGTQSQNLIDKYALIHLSTGDLLRSEIAKGSDLGRKAKDVMDRGELVSDEIVIGMIESKLDDNPNAKGFIFDGFPRTQAQAVALDDLLQKKGTGISAMLALEVEDEELVKRLLLRGKDSGRADDRDESVIRRRIREYNDKTLPLKNYYSEQGKFHSINGIGSIDEIFRLLVERITFIKAETELTALESDIEHLDLTVSDYEEAQDAEPELLLEIDAIKRAEAEEEEERRAEKRRVAREQKGSQQDTLATDILRVVSKAAGKKITEKIGREVILPAMKDALIKQVVRAVTGTGSTKKKPLKKTTARKKTTVRKKAAKKATAKKTTAGKATAKRPTAKKPAAKRSKATSKTKKSTAKKFVRKAVKRKPVKKPVKKTAPRRAKPAVKKKKSPSKKSRGSKR